MKVLHVIPSVSGRSGGPGQAIIPMCASLLAQGVEVLLATTDDGGVSSSEFRVSRSQLSAAHDSSLITHDLYKDVPTVFFPVQFGASFKYSRPFAQWLDKQVSDYDLVHIHAVFNHACIAAARACREKRVPYIVRPLGTLDPWSLQQKRLRKQIFWHGGIKTMLTGAAAIHYTTEGEKQAVETSLRLNHGVVVPLGVDVVLNPERVASVPAEKFAQRFPELGAHPYVLVLSRLHPKKALEVLLEAFISLAARPEFREWRLVLAGEGPADYVAALKRMVAQRNATELVVFPGWLEGDEKDAALSDASLLALPSHHENFGLCVMESLACGVPVLISPQVNLAPEIVAARAGWIANVEKAALEEALAEALGSAAELARRGEAGRTLASRFAWPVVATKLVELYDAVLKSSTVSTSPSLV